MCLMCWGKDRLFKYLKKIGTGDITFEEFFNNKTFLFDEIYLPIIFDTGDIYNYDDKLFDDVFNNDDVIKYFKGEKVILDNKVLNNKYFRIIKFFNNLSKNYNFCKNEYQYQGVFIKAKGEARDPKKIYEILEQRFLFNLYNINMVRNLRKIDNFCPPTFRPVYIYDVVKDKANELLKKSNIDIFTISLVFVYSHNSVLDSYIMSLNDTDIFLMCEDFTKKYVKWNKNLKPIDKVGEYNTYYLDDFESYKEDLLKFIENNEKVVIFCRYQEDFKKTYEFIENNIKDRGVLDLWCQY